MKLKNKNGYIIDVYPENKKMWDEFVSSNFSTNEWNKLVYELSKYEWLYKVACEIIHDMDGTEVDKIMKDLDRLWNLKNRLDRRNKNDN